MNWYKTAHGDNEAKDIEPVERDRKMNEQVSSTAPDETFRVAVNRKEIWARIFLEEPYIAVRVGEAGFERGEPMPNARGADRVIRQRNQMNLSDSPIPLIGPSVYRETSSKSALALVSLSEQVMMRHTPFFVSDNPDLALSQGGRDVLIEFDASLVNGYVNRSKPIAKELRQGYEFKVDRTVAGSVKSLTFRNKKTLDSFKTRFAKIFDFDNIETTDRGLKVVRRPEARSTRVAKAGEGLVFEDDVPESLDDGQQKRDTLENLGNE